MDRYISQPDKIVSWNQVYDLDTLVQFYVNCYNYLPELFIGAGVLAGVVGLYVAFNLEKIKFQVRILIIAGKMYLCNKNKFYKGGD